MRKVVEAYDDLEDEIKDWEEASLMDFHDWEKEEEKDKPIPVFVDPKTGKLYYEEPDAEPEIEVKMSGEPSLDVLKEEPINLDLDGDGIIEEEEIEEIFNRADTNDDGVIDEEEAKLANLDPVTAQKLNELNEALNKVKFINEKQKYDFNWNELDTVQQEIEKIKKLSFELGSLNNKKKEDDNTITYF